MTADKTSAARTAHGSRRTPYGIDAMFVTVHRSAAPRGGGAPSWRSLAA